MYYGKIKKVDSANGPGARTTIFVSGCRNKCTGCFQSETWDFCYGQEYTEETEKQLLEWLHEDFIAGLTILGGEPMEPENIHELVALMRKVKKIDRKDIWLFTGYTYEYLQKQMENGSQYSKDIAEALKLVDVLVDGPFVESKKNISLRFRGSENQRLIDLKKTLATGEVVLYERPEWDPDVFSPYKRFHTGELDKDIWD